MSETAQRHQRKRTGCKRLDSRHGLKGHQKGPKNWGSPWKMPLQWPGTLEMVPASEERGKDLVQGGGHNPWLRQFDTTRSAPAKADFTHSITE
jgi:hypothetical protein